MSNRTLIEINHDFASCIARSPETFVTLLGEYLRSGSRDHDHELRRFGVRIFGMRHHSDSFEVRWGTHAKPNRGRRKSETLIPDLRARPRCTYPSEKPKYTPID